MVGYWKIKCAKTRETQANQKDVRQCSSLSALSADIIYDNDSYLIILNFKCDCLEKIAITK